LNHSTLFLFVYNLIPGAATKSECGNFRIIWNLEAYFFLLHYFEALCQAIQAYRESNGKGVFLVSAIDIQGESFGNLENTVDPFSSPGHVFYEEKLAKMELSAVEALLELKQLLKIISCNLAEELEVQMQGISRSQSSNVELIGR
jgi:hypothetical protein